MLQVLLAVAGPNGVRRHLAPLAKNATGIKEAMLCKP
jgi:hypothetical protein